MVLQGAALIERGDPALGEICQMSQVRESRLERVDLFHLGGVITVFSILLGASVFPCLLPTALPSLSGERGQKGHSQLGGRVRGWACGI